MIRTDSRTLSPFFVVCFLIDAGRKGDAPRYTVAGDPMAAADDNNEGKLHYPVVSQPSSGSWNITFPNGASIELRNPAILKNTPKTFCALVKILCGQLKISK